MEKLNNHVLVTHESGGVREMTALALPMVASSACDTVMVFTDRLFLSKLGMEQMSASMAGGLSVFFMLTFFVGLMGYATAMTAQYYGAGEKNKSSLVLTQTILLCVTAYPIVLVFRPVLYMMFESSGVSSEQLKYQIIYSDVLLNASILILLRIGISNFFSGIGKTRVVMIASFGAMFANIIASYVFIFGKFGFSPMGIKGAAVGTISACVFSIAIMLFAYFRKSNREEFSVLSSFKVDFGIIKRMFRFGTPSGIEFFMTMFAFTLMISILHAHSPVTAAAATIMFSWDHVSFVPLLGLEIGVTSLVGRYVGAGQFDIVKKTVNSGLKLGWSISLFVLISFFIFPEFLSDIFKPSENAGIYAEAKPLAVFMIRFASVYVTFQAVMLVYMGALKGAGDTFWSMVINVSFNWVILAVLYMSLNVFMLNAATAWVVVVLVFIILPVILYMRFKTEKWKTIKR